MIAITEEIPQVRIALELNEKEHGQHVLRMMSFWADMNERFFGEVFSLEAVPIILFRPLLKEEMSDGIYTPAHRSGYDYPTMQLCEQILAGSHPLFEAGIEFEEGRLRYLEDVLLHETVHQFIQDCCWSLPGIWHELIEKDAQRMVELGRAGAPLGASAANHHGYAFCHKANQITEILQIPQVRVAAIDEMVDAEENDCSVEPFDDSPLCDYFPHNVRPKERYLNSTTMVK